MKCAATRSLPSNSSSIGQSCSARYTAERIAVTSMRSFGSRAMRTLIARGLGLAVDAMLVPCIGHAPCWNAGRRQELQPIPRPLVTPEIRLKALYWAEAGGEEPVASILSRRLRKYIGAGVARPSQMLSHLAVASDSTTKKGARPNVDGRNRLICLGQKVHLWPRKAALVGQQRVVAAVIKIEQGDR